ncbi:MULTISPECIES: carbonic anhydrase [unclassified Streptacidiphilus]|uniref:Carbonic anhydrase n=1 Tax=Streptacidiphilus cavernicola TaxID=3342716 RepID=A0ABV6UT53_9ACTN
MIHDHLRGVRDFQQFTAPGLRPELARLAREGQSPSQLFITCADSRLVPNVITSSGPGDLFTVRNVGNLVSQPGASQPDDSAAAAIEYAVDVLEVSTVVVCGHSGCGAMQSLLRGAHRREGQAGTPLTRWLRHGQDSLQRVRHAPARIRGSALSEDPLERLCLTNVAQQLDNLRAHASVRRALDSGRLRLTGLYFDFATAQAYRLARNGRTFSPVRPRLAPAA